MGNFETVVEMAPHIVVKEPKRITSGLNPPTGLNVQDVNEQSDG